MAPLVNTPGGGQLANDETVFDDRQCRVLLSEYVCFFSFEQRRVAAFRRKDWHFWIRADQ